MARIRIEQFRGIAPKIAPHLLEPNMAIAAKNCDLSSGSIRPWQNPLLVMTPTKVGTKQSMYLYAGQFWFTWLDDVDVVRGPIPGDAYERTYWTGDGLPKYTLSSIATAGGGTDYPNNAYTLGLPSPGAGMAVAVTGTPNPDPPVLDTIETRGYVVCYKTEDGQLGPPSPVTALETWSPGQSVELTNIPTAPTGAYNVASKELYRTNTGSSESMYQFVAEIPIAQASYTDTVPSSELGDILPSSEWDAPRTDMIGLCYHPAGFMVGFSGNRICFSEIRLPHAWPRSYEQTVDYPIVSVEVFGNSILITTSKLPYVMVGTDPSNMSPPERMEQGYSCVSKRGTVDMGDFILYPSPQGLVQVGVGGYGLATRDIHDARTWAAYSPSTIHAYNVNGQYIAFYGNGTGGFIFDPATGNFTHLDLYATAGFSDPATGALYLMVNGQIVKWDAGATPMTAVWEGRPFTSPMPINFGAGQVEADSYPVSFELYADGQTRHTRNVSNVRPFPLPGGYTARLFKIKVTTSKTVNRLTVASSQREIGQQG